MAIAHTQHARLGSETPLLEDRRDRYVGHDDAPVLPGISPQTSDERNLDASDLRHSEVRIKIRLNWSYIRDVNAKAF
jgi:hypothetical protein